MWKFNKMTAFGVGSTLALLVFTKYSFLGLNLKAEHTIGLLTFMGVILALKKYIDEKETSKKKDVSELVSFFRKEVLPAHVKFVNAFDQTTFSNKNDIIQIPLSNPTSEYLRLNFAPEALKQNKYLWDKSVSESSTELCNILEEFAFRVILLDSVQDQALTILRYTYCVLLEQQAVRIVAQRDMISNSEDMYKNSLELYKNWIDSIKSTDSTSNINRFVESFS